MIFIGINSNNNNVLVFHLISYLIAKTNLNKLA